jgi:hypothetical protein
MATAPIVVQPPAEVAQPPGSPYTVKILPINLQSALEQMPAQALPFQPGPRPERILLGTLGDLGFRVVKPIAVQLETREDGIVASWPEVDEFGTGTSVSSSAEDLGRTVAELYRTLENDRGKLGPDLQRIWAKLQEYVVPRR